MANIIKGTGTMALAAFDSGAELKRHEFGRPAPGPTDIQIDIKFCGMCHSDLHGELTFQVLDCFQEVHCPGS
jgi:D-arabinose 1-dehydrogenase-like Zn-dependent alcohol dehydrogenase